MKIGYYSSHEPVKPSALLTPVRRAEKAEFTAGTCSGQFHPWSYKRGETSFADKERARTGALKQWRGSVYPNSLMIELRRPGHFDEAGSIVDGKAFDELVRSSADLNRPLDWLLQGNGVRPAVAA